jgi:hypothetical protein
MIVFFGAIIIATVVGIGVVDLCSGMRLLERYDSPPASGDRVVRRPIPRRTGPTE